MWQRIGNALSVRALIGFLEQLDHMVARLRLPEEADKSFVL